MNWQDKIRNPNCTLCPLHKEAEHVCLMGSGTRKARIMVVGEAPGEREDESHRAFVGASGRLLRDSLRQVGIDPDKECYITNAAKCRPPENRTPDWSEIKTCRDAYFWQELEAVDPDFLLLLGNSALRAATGRSRITANRGSTFDVRGKTALATFHPAYVLRSPYHGSAYRADIAKLARLVRGESASQKSKTRVKVIRSRSQLKWLRTQLLTHDEVSLDLETNYHEKVQEYRESDPGGRIVCIGFSWKEGEGVVLPLHHPESPWKDPDATLRVLKPALEREGIKLIGHNFQFDARWLAAKGRIFIKQTFCTMLGAHMLDENRLKGLEPLAEIELGVEPYKISVGKIGAHNVKLSKLVLYQAQDTDYTLRLYHREKKQMKEELRIARVFAKLMMPASNAIVPVQIGGVWIDPDRYRKRLKQTIRKRDKVEAELRKSCGDINLRSPQQVAKWLFGPEDQGGLQLPIIERTKKNAPSTKETVILTLARQSPELRKLLEYRKWETKYIRTYFKQWSRVDENNRFHPEYKLFGTVTGRLSGDFQQVPRDPFMRSIVGAPPGWLFVDADYSQIELRLAAWIANERQLLRLFAMGEDAHLNTAVAITGKRPQDITPEERANGKHANFGFLYGMGAKKFVEYCWEHFEKVITLEEAQIYYDTYHRTYPALRRWHDRQRRLVHRYQRVHSPIGRVRHLPTVQSSERGVRSEAERQAINSPVQSLASDFMLLSLVRLSDGLPSHAARVVGTVHDSILFEVREGFEEELVPYIHDTMVDLEWPRKKFGLDLNVPLVVDIKVGKHWGEGEKWKF
jgi:uracil-DNA glycosylase family 4